jgi:hypothetical protein
MSQKTIDRDADYPVNSGFGPLDQEFEFDPNVSLRGLKELWAVWTPGGPLARTAVESRRSRA